MNDKPNEIKMEPAENPAMNAEPVQRQVQEPAPPASRQPQEPSFWNDDEKQEAYRSRWIEVQAEFVDDPTDSVRNADELVAEVIENLSDTFMEERSSLEDQWAETGDVSTEDLRVSLTRYRDLFDRLMTVGESNGRYE
jgi:hypothetical protein